MIIPRRVWRMTSDSPLGMFVDFDPTAPQPFDLLNGVEVRDHTDTIPGELFDKLFKR